MKKLFKQIPLIFKELKLVEWPGSKKTMQMTLLVLVISLFVGIIIVVFDTLLFKGRNIILEL
jgi:preprotein translocase SecE subunit